mgnify:CR=1 FL=1
MRALLIASLVFILSSCANTVADQTPPFERKLYGLWEVTFVSDHAPDQAEYMNDSGIMHRVRFQDDGQAIIYTLRDGNMAPMYETHGDTLIMYSGATVERFVYYPSEFPVSLRWLDRDGLILHLLPID